MNTKDSERTAVSFRRPDTVMNIDQATPKTKCENLLLKCIRIDRVEH